MIDIYETSLFFSLIGSLFASRSAVSNGDFQFKDDGEPINDDWVDVDDDDEGSVSSVDSERTRFLKEDFEQQVGRE